MTSRPSPTSGSILDPFRGRMHFVVVTMLGGAAAKGPIRRETGGTSCGGGHQPADHGSGGNVGEQSTAIFAPDLPLGPLDLRRFGSALRAGGDECGFSCGTPWDSSPGWSPAHAKGLPTRLPAFRVAVGMSLLTVAVLASLLRISLPHVLTRAGFDRAQGAEPSQATSKDVSRLALRLDLIASLL